MGHIPNKIIKIKDYPKSYINIYGMHRNEWERAKTDKNTSKRNTKINVKNWQRELFPFENSKFFLLFRLVLSSQRTRIWCDLHITNNKRIKKVGLN